MPQFFFKNDSRGWVDYGPLVKIKKIVEFAMGSHMKRHLKSMYSNLFKSTIFISIFLVIGSEATL